MSDLEHVSKRIANHCPPVSVWRIHRRLERFGTRRDRAPIGLIGIGDIYIEERGEGVAHPNGANHHQRIADPDLGWPALDDVTRCAEGGSQELNSALDIRDHHSRCHRVVAVGGRRIL